jgi:ADP-ribosylglycohydrolase
MAVPADYERRRERLKLALDGLSLGDAFGQMFFYRQSWATARDSRLLPPPPWTYTDDTEMAAGIADVLEQFGEINQDELAKVFADRYVQNPHRGYGSGAHDILTAIHRGTAWRTAAGAVFDGQGSMGNGAAMRVAPVGAWFADDLKDVVEQARLSAEVTHLHSEGIAGAIAVAVACARCCQAQESGVTLSREVFFDVILSLTPSGATRDGIEVAAKLPAEMWSHDAAARLGNGARITSQDTVPFCLWVASRQLDDYTEALWETVHVGGDIDTNGAIVGGIVALAVGVGGLPSSWLKMREELR